MDRLQPLTLTVVVAGRISNSSHEKTAHFVEAQVWLLSEYIHRDFHHKICKNSRASVTVLGVAVSAVEKQSKISTYITDYSSSAATSIITNFGPNGGDSLRIMSQMNRCCATARLGPPIGKSPVAQPLDCNGRDSSLNMPS